MKWEASLLSIFKLDRSWPSDQPMKDQAVKALAAGSTSLYEFLLVLLFLFLTPSEMYYLRAAEINCC